MFDRRVLGEDDGADNTLSSVIPDDELVASKVRVVAGADEEKEVCPVIVFRDLQASIKGLKDGGQRVERVRMGGIRVVCTFVLLLPREKMYAGVGDIS